MKERTRFACLVVLFLVFVLTLGTTGYCFIEPDWSLFDALYVAVITITTVGFGETHDLSATGRVFTVGLIFVGVAVVGFVSSHAARLLIDSEMRLVLGRGRMEKAIRKLRNHSVGASPQHAVPDATLLAHRDTVTMCVDGRYGNLSIVREKAASKRILIVDDQRALRMQLVRKLRAAGHTLSVAASGEEAVAVASDVRPQLIALHAAIQGTDAYETCRVLKEMPELADCRLILYAADGGGESDTKGWEYMADECLQEGHKTSELVSRIQELLSAA